jgi:CRISPR-associated endonuclease/helicase Cas3
MRLCFEGQIPSLGQPLSNCLPQYSIPKMHQGSSVQFWAKTVRDTDGLEQPGISVRDHCLNVGCVAEAIIASLPPPVRALLPGDDGRTAALLAALHDVGKITIGFQAKCPTWLTSVRLPPCSGGDIALSVTDHAHVSQAFLQRLPNAAVSRLWFVAVGSHHGRPKGRMVRLNNGIHVETLSDWAEGHRQQLRDELESVFGPLPMAPPDPLFAPYHSDLWLLAGLITVADWIGSNETWFSPGEGLRLDSSRSRACDALRQIGWPGGKLRSTSFAEAFGTETTTAFTPNKVQEAVAAASLQPGIIVVEGLMGCGKTEAALFAAQQLIAAGHHQGIYFALPTQVTSNRIYRRIERFLRNTLADDALLRLAHGNAWLEDDFNLRLTPSFQSWKVEDGENPDDHIREGRSWFASAKQALLAPYGVGTIDQALQAVVAVKHFFVRRFALAGKVVILDEIHSYDIYTGTLVTALIRELVNLRCTVIILSATLTAERRRELLASARIVETEAPSAYPLITSGTSGNPALSVVAEDWPSRPTIAIRPAIVPEAEVVEELLRRAEAGQNVLWIRNTVVDAQQSFRAASAAVREDTVRVGLLHSRFPFHRRSELEDDWLELLGKDRPVDRPGSILIATQVVEQSVDIDLDFIVSDLAPTDMLLQRVGRLWRHERPQRKATAPEFWIRLPELPATDDTRELKKALGRSARVYAPYVLLRTLEVWSGKSELRLPSDIRSLLEATYAEPAACEPQAWQELHAELEAEKRQLSANAEAATLVLGRPTLDDKEEILTRRKGAPTTPVLLLRSLTTDANGTVHAIALDETRAEISEHEWRRASAKFLHQWIVRAPRWMVPANAPRPRWLALHGPSGVIVATVGDDGRCDFGEGVPAMTYDPRLGIFSERPTITTPQRNDDDDDEFDS